jgi:tetratricopeptide (TPR) repeat protein
MSHTRILLIAAVFVALAAASEGRSQQVTGQVRYADTNQPAYPANIHCDGTGTSHIEQTDRSGKFTCRLGSPGNYTVRADAPGYIQEQQSGTALDTNQSDYMLFRLKPMAAVANKTPVTASSTVDAKVPAEARKQFDMGVAALANGKKESAEAGIRYFEKAIELYPNFEEAWLRLGTTYMDLGQWDKAEQALRKTLAIDPKAANAFFALGEVYLHQKRNDEAEKSLLEGLQFEANSAQGHLSLGRVYWDTASKIKDEAQARPGLEKAYEEVKKALTLDPNLAQAHVLKGNLLLRVRRAEDAQKEFEEYLRLEPKGPFAEQARMIVEKIKKALASAPK